VKIKICGLTRERDIEFANEAKPDYIGFVFADSKRKVSLEQAKTLKSKLSGNIAAVGVFVKAEIADIMTAARGGVIDIIQFHGNESEDFINQIKAATGLPIIKAVNVTCADDITQAEKVYSTADFLLFDGAIAGSGQGFDWDAVKLHQCKKPYFLAGGINSDNIEAAMKISPYAIDTSSGAETDGVKDRDKIITMVNKVKNN